MTTINETWRCLTMNNSRRSTLVGLAWAGVVVCGTGSLGVLAVDAWWPGPEVVLPVAVTPVPRGVQPAPTVSTPGVPEPPALRVAPLQARATPLRVSRADQLPYQVRATHTTVVQLSTTKLPAPTQPPVSWVPAPPLTSTSAPAPVPSAPPVTQPPDPVPQPVCLIKLLGLWVLCR